MIAIQLIQGQPDQFFRGADNLCIRLACSGMQLPRNLADSGTSVAMLPDQRRRRVQTVRAVPLDVIHQYFTVEFFHDQILAARFREDVMIHLGTVESWPAHDLNIQRMELTRRVTHVKG